MAQSDFIYSNKNNTQNELTLIDENGNVIFQKNHLSNAGLTQASNVIVENVDTGNGIFERTKNELNNYRVEIFDDKLTPCIINNVSVNTVFKSEVTISNPSISKKLETNNLKNLVYDFGYGPVTVSMSITIAGTGRTISEMQKNYDERSIALLNLLLITPIAIKHKSLDNMGFGGYLWLTSGKPSLSTESSKSPRIPKGSISITLTEYKQNPIQFKKGNITRLLRQRQGDIPSINKNSKQYFIHRLKSGQNHFIIARWYFQDESQWRKILIKTKNGSLKAINGNLKENDLVYIKNPIRYKNLLANQFFLGGEGFVNL